MKKEKINTPNNENSPLVIGSPYEKRVAFFIPEIPYVNFRYPCALARGFTGSPTGCVFGIENRRTKVRGSLKRFSVWCAKNAEAFLCIRPAPIFDKDQNDIRGRRIAIITPSFLPVRGGTEQVVYELGRRMAEKNKIVIITPKLRGAPYREQIKQMSIYRFPTLRLPILNALSAQLVLLFILPYLLRKEKIELIHMYHVYQLGGAIVLIKKLLRIPLFTYLSGWDTYDPIRPVPRLLWPYIAWVLNASEKVCTSCQNMRENAQKQGCIKEIPLIPHGTNMQEIEILDINVRNRYGIGAEKIVFSLQRLFPRKGLEYLIRAIPLVIKQYPAVRFIIGGKGPEREKLEREVCKLEVSDYVIFAGFIPDNELKAYYAAADVFALPSLYEGFGVVYIDALINGVPVVTTCCGGPEDIITKENGFLVPIRDEKAFAKALIEALKKTWNHEKIKKQARRYDWKNVIEGYREVYQELLGTRKNL